MKFSTNTSCDYRAAGTYFRSGSGYPVGHLRLSDDLVCLTCGDNTRPAVIRVTDKFDEIKFFRFNPAAADIPCRTLEFVRWLDEPKSK